MKVVKIIIGVVSVLIAAVTALQTYALAVITNVAGDVLGSLGPRTGSVTMAAFLVGGLIAIIMCDSKLGSFTAGTVYLAEAVIGFYKMGEYGDMLIWAVVSAVFVIVFALDSIFTKQPVKPVLTG